MFKQYQVSETPQSNVAFVTTDDAWPHSSAKRFPVTSVQRGAAFSAPPPTQGGHSLSGLTSHLGKEIRLRSVQPIF